MRSNFVKATLKTAVLAVTALLLGASVSFAQQQVNLTAGPTTATLPDGSVVPMWGYSCGTAVGGSTATCAALKPNTLTPLSFTFVAWAASTAYTVGQLTQDANGNVQMVTQAGKSGTSAPAWNTTGTTSEGPDTLVWTFQGSLANFLAANTTWSPVVITVPSGQNLQINLTNNLSFNGNLIPTSLVIVGQLGGGLGSPTSAPSPTHAVQVATWPIAGDTNGGTFNPPSQGRRVQSFATEVAAGATTSLTWTAPRPGTYLIESGTHPSIQGPMGLYGILVVTSAPSGSTAGTAYPGVSYNAEIPLLFSEIDKMQNSAVQAAVSSAGFSETSARVLRDSVTSVTLTLDASGNVISGGSGYHVGDPIAFVPASACTVQPTAQVGSVDTNANNAILTVKITNNGQGCTQVPNATATTGGTGAQLTAALSLAGVMCSDDAAACYPPVVNYTPLYYLINGTAFDKTRSPASLFAASPGTVDNKVTGSVLVRMVNAGLRMHVPSIVGAQTGTSKVGGFSLIAEDGNPLPGATRVQSEVFMAAGKTYDVMINVPDAGTAALPIFDRQLSLSANQTNRDAGMLAYIGINGATAAANLPVAAELAGAAANPDTYNAVVPGQALTISDVSKGVIANDFNVYGVKVSLPPTYGSVVLSANGSFTYTPGASWSATTTPTTSDSFQYCANGTTSVCATVTLGASTVANNNSGVTCTGSTYTASTATYLAIKTPGVLAGCTDGANLPLTVDTTTVSANGMTVVPDANGGFTATASGAGTYTFTFQAKNSLKQSSAVTTVKVNFLAPNGPTVTVLDGKDKTTIADYRWIIEEDRTFYVDPHCTTNPLPADCPSVTTTQGGQSVPAVFGTNFHTSYMPVVASGCTGPLSCESGQSVQGQAAVCDVGNGVCRTDATQQTAVDPSQAHLDPTKRYYISVLPGDAAQPFIAGYAGAPDCSPAGKAAGSCGHGMGGAPIAPGQPTVTVLSQPTPFPPATLSVFVFEDDWPLNGEHNAGGGLDVLAPQEPGLGGFQITIFDDAGGTGDATGQPTYDMFNMPLSNSLVGTIDPTTGMDACPVSQQVTANAQLPNSQAGDCSVNPNAKGCQKGIVGMIVTCPKYESDGKTLSPLAGQAVVKNLYPGRYGVTAMPGADRFARGEEWLQTNTLDGQKAHDSFMRIGEPGYFQEFGPAGYHVSIGFVNPKVINDRKRDVCSGTTCTNEVKGHVTTARMSRTPDQRLYGSSTRDSFSFTQCYASLGDPDGAEFAFVKCDANGNFDLTGIPAGNWKLTLFDQWNDQIVDGISTPVGLKDQNGVTLDMGEIAAHQWQANIYTRTFLDISGDGVSQDTEPGLPLVATNIRFRDGSFSNFNNTDLNGYAGFNEVFPLFSWYVVETDSTRYKSTGTHVVQDAGGPTDGNPGGGSSNIAGNFANTVEHDSLPENLRFPGSVYCADADCTGKSIATGPIVGGASGPTSGPLSTGRIDPPTWFGSYGWQGFAGQNSFLEFGKKLFAPGENGGIHGHVVYASTRPFDDPQLLLQLSWEPLVPHVRVNLYKEGVAADGVTPILTLVDHTETSSFDDWAQGFRSDGVPNMNCPGQTTDDPYWFGLKDQPNYLDWYNNVLHGNAGTTPLPNNSQFKCYDGMHNWNQLQPAPYDGMYSFPSVTSVDPSTGKPAGTNCTACVTNPDASDPYRYGGATQGPWTPAEGGTPMLPAGKYVVEVVVPPGYELVKEEDKNILIGDNYIAPVTQQFAGLGNVFILPDQAEVTNATNALNSTANLGVQPRHEGDTGSVESFWPCVGEKRIVPDYISLFPGSAEVAPFAGAWRNLCDRKEVALDDQTAALAKFYIFTPTHVASHYTGVITDDFTGEFDPFSPQFGEKFAPAYLPVSIKDWAGNEISRVYADQWGAYNGLNYSTWEVNPPNPTGYGPTMMVTCMNDRGTGTTPDPLFQPGYSQFCYELPFMPGQTGYFDTPVVPTSAFSEGYNHPDCAYPDTTPAIASVIGSDSIAGPWVSGVGSTLTITALPDQLVDNYAYSGPKATAPPFNQQKVLRHYDFGDTAGTVALVGSDGVAYPLTSVSWSKTTITGGVPAGLPACAVPQQEIYGGSSAQCGQLVITAANGKQSIDTVTVTIGGKKPTVLTAGQTIQSAIDAASPGDMIIVPPGNYNEMVIMWKPIRLQGVGAASTVIDANSHPAGKLLDPWRQKVVCLFGLTPDGQPSSGPYGNCPGTGGGPNYPAMVVDRIPMEGILGWDTTVNGNLAEQLIEPSLMGAYEGAAITVVAKGVNIPAGAQDVYGSGAESAFPDGTVLLGQGDCLDSSNATNPYPSNFYCNPSSIDGFSVINSSQGGGGILVHAWAHNIQIANNRVHNNTGTMSGGITIGQGEHVDLPLAPNANNAIPPGSCEDGAITNQGLPFCYNVNVNIHNNAVTLNSSMGDELFSSTPAGAGGVTLCNGADYYNFNYNWVCGNMSTGDGGGVAHIGWSKNGHIEHNSILFNQSANPTITANGGGVLVMGAPDPDPPCGSVNDKDCVVTAPGSIGPSDGTGPGLVINANLILGNSADSGSGGGLRLQHVNGSDVVNFPDGATSCSKLDNSCLWNWVSVTNNIISNNVAGWDGGGVSLQDALAVNIVNNTIVSNDSTASAGPLFSSLFAPLASTQGTGCTVNNGAQSCPQVAGLVSISNSAVLQENLPAGLTCPPGHGTTGSNPSCGLYSVPLLANNIIWQNRSFFIGIGTGPLDLSNQQDLQNQQRAVTLYNSPSDPNSMPVHAMSQGVTGACPTASYWDIGVRGDTGPSNHVVVNGVTLRLAPTYSVITDATDYPSANNTGSNPTVLSQYCNGSRVPPENGGMGFQVPPGTNELNGWVNGPPAVFSLTPSATVDEGNNWINLRWGPLALTNPSSGATLGNYVLAKGSPAIDTGTSTAAPSTDFFGNPRPAGGGFDIGAYEYPRLSLSPSSYNFGNQAVLTTSAAQVFTLRNPAGGDPVTGLAVSVTGTNATEYAISANTCGTSLGLGAQCTISVTFTPSLLGARTATLTVTDSEGTQTAALTGTGTGPLYSVTPASLSFPNTVVATVSAPLSATVRNNQTTSMTITTRSLGGLFPAQYAIATGTTCAVGTVVNSGATCVINLTFNPQTVLGLGGIRPANLQLTASGLTTNVGLSGNAILFAVDITPKGAFGINGALAFPNTQVGTVSAPLTATLTNYQSTPITFNSVTVPAPFHLVTGAGAGTCSNGSTVAPNGGSCTIVVNFAPTSVVCILGVCGNTPDLATATTNLSGSPVNPTISLSGTATPDTATLSGTAAYGSQQIGTAAAHTFTYTNTSGGSITVTGVTRSQPLLTTGQGDFVISANTCTGTVAAGGNCTFVVTFTPSATGTRTAAVTVTASNASNQALTLTGTGTPARATTTPGTIAFAATTRGAVSATTLVTLSNPAGNPNMTGTSIAFGGTNAAYFRRSTTTAGSCPTTATFTVNAGTSCTIGVVFAPPSAGSGGTTGAKSGTMTITTTSTVPPPTPAVTLSGTAN